MRNLVVGCIGMGAFVLAALGFAQVSTAEELSAAPEMKLETLLSAQLDGVELLVFRVHKLGRPERVLVE